MASKTPKSIDIRAYQVGFGDCFLVSFIYASDKRHILIDFGTTELPKRGSPKKPALPSKHMPEVAKQIAKDCGGKLTAVIATHRHADHISGFGTDNRTGDSGTIIKGLKPDVVLQPWTEDPDAAEDARKATRDSRTAKSFVAGLSAMQDVAAVVHAIAESKPASMSPKTLEQLRFIGEDNISNVSAVKNLIAMGRAKGATAVWAHHGSTSGLDKLLPGVKVEVFGPPNLNQSEGIKSMRQSDPDQFWQLIANASERPMAQPLAAGMPKRRAKPGHAPVPAEARWFVDHLKHLRGEQLLQIVTALDDQMNNTSLILLFTVGKKKLLFPGDAQIENWSYALRDAKDAARTRAKLADVDFYKVGHHGSRNATPRKLLWDNFTKKGPKKTLKTMVSTLPGKHGSSAKKSEVPRRTLLEALKAETHLENTNDLEFGAEPEMYQLTKIKV
jgi:hypothetical protein